MLFNDSGNPPRSFGVRRVPDRASALRAQIERAALNEEPAPRGDDFVLARGAG